MPVRLDKLLPISVQINEFFFSPAFVVCFLLSVRFSKLSHTRFKTVGVCFFIYSQMCYKCQSFNSKMHYVRICYQGLPTSYCQLNSSVSLAPSNSERELDEEEWYEELAG